MNFFFALVCGLVIGFCIGWDAAHMTVAEECKKLGAFFVGSEVFKCIEVKRGD